MRQTVLLRGQNFSGRSDYLRHHLLSERSQGPVVFVGPSASSALTGLAGTIAEELALFEGWRALSAPDEWSAYFAPRLGQRLASLSGGEQVLVALVGTARADLRAVGVDCALEHLDDSWRVWSLAYLRSACETGSTYLIDNRIVDVTDPSDGTLLLEAATEVFPMQLAPAGSDAHSPVKGASIIVEHLSFAYQRGADVLRNCTFELLPGSIYRLRGANGAGKSTLIRLLAGVLPFRRGQMFLSGMPYQPYREGNRALAVSMQNPDDQWTDVTAAGDLHRRLRHLLWPGSTPSADVLLADWKKQLGLTVELHRHVLDLPRVLRKRLSWLWPLSGFLPWIVLDEPTIGQDNQAVAQFVSTVQSFADHGYGVIFASHDRRLTDALAAVELVVEHGEVRACR